MVLTYRHQSEACAEGRRKVHVGPVAAAALARLRGRKVSRAALEVLAADSVADGPGAAEEFRIRLTPLRDGLRASREPPRGDGRPE